MGGVIMPNLKEIAERMLARYRDGFGSPGDDSLDLARAYLTLQKQADGLGQLLAHVHLHLTNDEDFSADELAADIRKLEAGKWIDTESLLVDLRQKLAAETIRADKNYMRACKAEEALRR